MTNSEQQKVNPLKSLIWLMASLCTVYYSNFFFNVFYNPNVLEPFISISLASFTYLSIFALYVCYVLPRKGVKNCEEYNPKIINVGAGAGAIAIVSFLIAIWPVWGFTSLWMFALIWKGFWELATIMPRGQFSDLGML